MRAEHTAQNAANSLLRAYLYRISIVTRITATETQMSRVRPQLPKGPGNRRLTFWDHY